MARPRKPPEKLSRRRDARRHLEVDRRRPWVELYGEPAPAPRLRGRAGLHVMTRRWWDTWVEFGLEAGWLGTDWERLLMVVQLVEQFWRSSDPRLAAEIRRNEKCLSAGMSAREQREVLHGGVGDA